jgi:basic membrane protein A
VSSRSGLIPSIVIVVIVFASVGGWLFLTNPYEPSRIAMVVMEPGLGDLSFTDQAYEGIEEVRGYVAVSHHIEIVESTTEGQTALNDLAQQGIYQLIIALGQDLTAALENAATNNPNQYFALIGGNLDLANVASAIFEPEEGAYLAGIIAAFLAVDDSIRRVNLDPIVGIIASVESDPTVQDLVSGFIQGLTAANERYNLNVTLLSTEFLGGYNKTQAAESASYSMYVDDGATVIFAPVRAAIVGIRNGAILANASEDGNFDLRRKPLIIAAEGNLDYYGCANPEMPIAPSWIATSVILRTDLPVFSITNKTLWNEFPSNELLTYNLMNNGVNITNFEYSSTYIPDEAYSAFRYYHDSILNGTISIT